MATYLADGMIICIRGAFEKTWEPTDITPWRGLDWYVACCLVAFVSCVAAMGLQERWARQPGAWGKVYTRIFVLEAWVGELVVGTLVAKMFSQCMSFII